MRSAFLAILVGVFTCGTAHAASFVYAAEGSPLVYLKGTAAPPALWQTPSASESAWTPSSTGYGIGYGDGDDRTVLSDMLNGYLTVYVRSHFTVGAERPSLTRVELKVRYDDGFVAYLNGTEVGRAAVPQGTLSHQSAATSHEVTDSIATFTIDPSLLVAGDNVFAAEVHNQATSSSDLSFIPDLVGYDAAGPSPKITIGPYVQQLDRNGFTLCWETDLATTGRVSYGTTSALGLVATDPTSALRHEVPITGLAPGTSYFFRVDGATGLFAAGQTRTEGDRDKPLRVVAFGDTRTNKADHAAVVTAIAAADPHLVLNTGDLVESSTALNWANFFDVETTLMSRTLLLPSLGNHEGDGVLYREKFVLPTSSPGGERYYVRKFAQVGVVTIDVELSTYAAGSAQHTFVRDSLAALAADPGIRFILVQLHHGPYSSGSHGSNTTIRSDYGPLFQQYGVDIVFSGHDHDYERSTASGVKYVVTGGGGAPLYSVPGDTFTEAKATALHYCLMEIDGATLHFRALGTDGTKIDEFWLGQAVNECALDGDCAGRTAGTCAASEIGAWKCVAKACLWNCSVRPPPGPDAGTPGPDAGRDAGAPPRPDGALPPAGDGGSAAGPDAASASGSDVGTTTARADASSPDAGTGAVSPGCGCATGRADAGATPLGLLAALAISGWRRSRRRT